MQTASAKPQKSSDEACRQDHLPTALRTAIIFVLFPFSILTAAALWHHGYLGIFFQQFQSYGAAQVLVDLVIALSLILTWMWSDAKKTNRAFLPWAIITLVAGSFGPLLYVVFSKADQAGIPADEIHDPANTPRGS